MERLLIILFAVLALFYQSCSPSPEDERVSTVYVSTSGSDGNDGKSPSKAVKSIQVGINKAIQYRAGKVKVAQGVYTPGNGLNSSDTGFSITTNGLKVIGGWNSDFSSVVGYSELDGNNNLYHIVAIDGVANVQLKNFVVRRGSANGGLASQTKGGGIYIKNSSSLLIENVVISNNTAQYGGAGIFLERSSGNTLVNITISSNSAVSYGGAIHLEDSDNNTINATIFNNLAGYGAGIYLTANSSGNSISGSIRNNNSTQNGGGIYVWNSPNTRIEGAIINNTALNGGAIYILNSANVSIVNSVITNNLSTAGLKPVIYLENNGNITGLIISNCIIGSISDTDYVGILEGGTFDTTGHVLMDNKFVTNRLRYLYREYTGSRLITNSTSDWNNINNTSLLDTTSGSTNNTVVNF